MPILYLWVILVFWAFSHQLFELLRGHEVESPTFEAGFSTPVNFIRFPLQRMCTPARTLCTNDEQREGVQKENGEQLSHCPSGVRPPPPQCLRIGVQEDIFVSNHIQAFGKQKKSSVRLGKATQCLRIGVQEDIFISNHIQAIFFLHLGQTFLCLSPNDTFLFMN